MFYMLCGVLGLLLTFFMVNGAIRVFRERKRKGLIDDHAVQIVSTQENDDSKTAEDVWYDFSIQFILQYGNAR